MNPWYKSQQPIIALAAIDGVSDTAFRQVCKSWGADVVFTEFIHSTGLIRSAKYRDPILKYDEIERPVIVQIYGNNPEDFYKAALFTLNLGFDGVDINMGCPSKTVAGHGSGCALMRNPKLSAEIVKSVLKARDEYTKEKNILSKNKPVSVKMRIGYDEIIGPEFAKVLADAGAEALIVHGRTLKMGYAGLSNWEVIGQVAKAVPIPVIGNGDVKSSIEVIRAIELGCVGVTISRATFGNPFLFYEIKKELGLDISQIEQNHPQILNEVNLKELSINLRLETYLKHIELAFKDLGERGLIESRKHISGYVNSFEHASDLRQRLIFAKSIEEIKGIISNANLNIL